ncbi:MAG TPA: membrane protein insertase YidC, partial [Polyangiaceae bacterium]|nr:membrane protein insertase YidC [Polyangiaceae bacterium]
KRTLPLIIVSVGIGLLYLAAQEYMTDEPEAETTEATEASEAEGAPAEEEAPSAPAAATHADAPAISEAARLALRTTGTIVTESFEADIDNLGGGLTAFRLVGDPRFRTDDGSPEDLITTSTPGHAKSSADGSVVYGEDETLESLRVQLGGIEIPEDVIWDLEQVSEREVRLTWEGDGIRVVRSLLAGEGPYQLWQTVRIENTANYERTTRLEMETWHWVERAEESGGFIASRSKAISAGVCVYGPEADETERKTRDNLTEDGIHGYGSGDVQIAAVENVFFTQAMAAPTDAPAARCSLTGEDRGRVDDEPVGTLFRAQLIYPWQAIEAGGSQTYRTLAYLGPKDRGPLHLAGHHLPAMIDLGFFALIANQLARLLSFIQGFVPNWGFAIILLTLLIRLTLFPLTNLSFKSMAKMRRLKPEMNRITELYKDDAEKKGAATMELYRKHKINPLAGCLPSLVQMPVWFALYRSLSTNIELYHMPFALWWTDLSSPDPYYVLPVMLGALMHIQQRLSPTTMDATQAKMMMYFMPIMITVFMLFLPSGLCLYMLTNSALGIAQMQLNEYRLGKEAETTGPLGASDDDDEPEPDTGGDDSAPKSQKRRPRRKRKVRRGRA